MNLYGVIAALTFFLMPTGATLLDENLNPVVDLPAGYFLLLTEGDAPSGYAHVAYDDLRGLVELATVRAVDYTPVTKYERTARFKCENDGQPVNLRAAPYRSAKVLKTLEPSASGRVYGTATGDALIKNGDTLWYYVDAGGTRGYCYYAHVIADDPPPNVIEKEEQPASSPVSGEPTAPSKNTAPPTAVIVLIVALCVPVPFIMFYMFKKKKGS
ncbi:MAG: hypothetical protein J1G38_03215 [Clostridiales bacterium]|nr:hypothetical protein [Clostridiales bacterium]